jgi:hypothetical protein
LSFYGQWIADFGLFMDNIRHLWIIKSKQLTFLWQAQAGDDFSKHFSVPQGFAKSTGNNSIKISGF